MNGVPSENSVSCDSLRLTLKEPFQTEADGGYYDKHFIVLGENKIWPADNLYKLSK